MHADELASVLRPVVRLAEGTEVILLQGYLLPEQRLQVEDHALAGRVQLLQVEGDDPARSDLVEDRILVAHALVALSLRQCNFSVSSVPLW